MATDDAMNPLSDKVERALRFVIDYFEDRGETVGNRAWAFCKEALADRQQCGGGGIASGRCLKCNMGPLRESCAHPEACEHPCRELALKLNLALLSSRA